MSKSQKPLEVFDFRDYMGKDPGPPRDRDMLFGQPVQSEACPLCHRPIKAFKWFYFYEASNQPWKAMLYRLINR